MVNLLHHLVTQSNKAWSERSAVTDKKSTLTYSELAEQVKQVSFRLNELGLNKFDRVGIYLPKTFENVISIFATSLSGGVFVPINPVLKAQQVEHISSDCNIKVLITNSARFKSILPILSKLNDLQTVILTDNPQLTDFAKAGVTIILWKSLIKQADDKKAKTIQNLANTSSDMAAIFYTSGSTGKPKGVVLSHQNIIYGAQSVAQYLENTEQDKILAVLPFSFDYGFSQLTTGLLVGAEVILLDYLLANDVLTAIEKHQVTGLAGVPPLWSKLAKLDWKDKGNSIRYFTNSGGAMNQSLLLTLRDKMKNASPYLMYGLTEAFRSTYLHPDKVDSKPSSMGQAIPNAFISVVREDGSECDIGEEGELVHSGPLVSLGYWNAAEKTQKRFKVAPGVPDGIVMPQMAVYSGDRVKKDEDGDLYFIGRNDEMIKSSGYRISPMELEECIYKLDNVLDVAALGITHNELGQGILIIASVKQKIQQEETDFEKQIKTHCQKHLANFMQPTAVQVLGELPFNGNGKIDRSKLANTYKDYFMES